MLCHSKLMFTFTGATKMTNRAALWYVPFSLKNVDNVTEVPPIKVGQCTEKDEVDPRH